MEVVTGGAGSVTENRPNTIEEYPEGRRRKRIMSEKRSYFRRPPRESLDSAKYSGRFTRVYQRPRTDKGDRGRGG